MRVQKFQLLDYLNTDFSSVDLDCCHIICVQHIVASTISLFNSLFEKGLDPKNLSAIGKCYSTRPDALQYLLEKKVNVAPESLHFDPYKSFDSEFRRLLIDFFQEKIRSLENEGCKKLIVLDDGGELLLFINALLQRSAFWRGKVVGIEQTTAGYDKLKKESLLFPVINVARSNIKLFHESPFIASVAVSRLLEHLNKLNISPKKALIIGNGAVGSHIYSEIMGLYITETFDLDDSKSTIQKSVLSDIIRDFDLIIGCTGKTVITPSQFPFLKQGACLVSVSSSDREFSGVEFRKNIKNIYSCHQDVSLDGVYLLNCGFPINFDEAYEEIDIPEFQLTRAILLAGIYQSITKSYMNGLIDLDANLQGKIYHLYNQIFFDSVFTKEKKSFVPV